MALIGSGAYGANLAKLMWNHVHKCFWMAKYRKPKSFKQPFFDWIKITDFLIAKLIIFWEWKMTPKNSQFCYKKICNFDPIKKGLLEWFWFSIFCHPKTYMNMGSHQFSQVRAVCTSAYSGHEWAFRESWKDFVIFILRQLAKWSQAIFISQIDSCLKLRLGVPLLQKKVLTYV